MLRVVSVGCLQVKIQIPDSAEGSDGPPVTTCYRAWEGSNLVWISITGSPVVILALEFGEGLSTWTLVSCLLQLSVSCRMSLQPSIIDKIFIASFLGAPYSPLLSTGQQVIFKGPFAHQLPFTICIRANVLLLSSVNFHVPF